MAALGEDRRIRSLIVLAAFALVFQKGIDLPGIHREFPARQIERVTACRAEKRPVVRDDEAGLGVMPQKVFEQNLRSQIEEVGGLVEQEQVGFMEQKGRELDARLPASRELREGAVEV